MIKKIYCIKCNNYRKFENTKIEHIIEETLILSSICDGDDSQDEKIFKEQTNRILKLFGLISNM